MLTKEMLIEYGNTKKGADVYFRDDWGCYYFSLLGKCFGMLSDDFITLKGNKEENETLRETYKDIIPGYYSNKLHWNSIMLNSEVLTLDDFKAFIDLSYDLVFAKLTKKDKAIVLETK